MLWAAPLSLVGDEGGEAVYTLYGFVDVSGKLVVPQRYDGYRYCTNKEGRVSFVIASIGEQKDDIYDLTGKLLMQSPTPDTVCGGMDRVIIRHIIDAEASKSDEGLLNVVTGKIEIPIGRNRHLTVVNPASVNVSDPRGEYFDDLLNNTRIPHPGYLDEQATIGDGVQLIVTDRRRDLTTKDVKVGVIDSMGGWLLKPSLTEATGFNNGFSVIPDGDQYTFMNTSMKPLGGAWDEIQELYSDPGNTVVGYLVTRGSERGLLGMDLSTIIPPGSADINCSIATGACAVTEGGATSMVQLPASEKKPLPQGFNQVLSPAFFAEAATGDGEVLQRIYLVGSDKVVTLAAKSSCEAAANIWVSCTSHAGMVAPMVLNAAGQVTPFASVAATTDPAPEAGYAYYWVTSGGMEGFVDGNGTWRYQQSRYTQLED